ncbi:MAG: hypothetical protein LBL90_13110 [Prevotellaceae bacterium]|jgi:SanA protein|nr:hypothetical protein [Prevotellaceae bacterium]
MKILLLFAILIIIAIWLCNVVVNKKSNPYIYDNVADILYNKVDLLFGTSKYLHSGTPNEYFANRITAAADLYNSGKIVYIVASGDNHSVKRSI